MVNQQKTKSEIIDEVAAYYNLGNRAFFIDIKKEIVEYQYLTSDGRMCPVALFAENPKQSWKGNAMNAFPNIDEVLKPEYRGHGFAFWVDIQQLHDNGDLWTEEGLNKAGRKEVSTMKYYWEKS